MKNHFLILIAIISVFTISCKKDNNNKVVNNSYQILFTENITDSTTQIVKINDDGTNRAVIPINGSPINISEIFSQTFLYYKDELSSDSNSLYMYNITNNTSTFLHRGKYIYYGAISPDKSKVAFYENGLLSTMNTNLTNYVQYPYKPDGDGDGAIQFSKDNSKIIFLKYNGIDYWSDLCSINIDGTGLTYLSSNIFQDGPYFGGYRISNYNIIAYVREDIPNQLKTISYTGTNGNNLYTANSGEYVDAPSWSNDGNKLAFTKYDINDVGNVYIINKDGSNLTKVTNNTSDEFLYTGFQWSPDNNKILYIVESLLNEGSYKLDVYTLSDNSFKTISSNARNAGYWIK